MDYVIIVGMRLQVVLVVLLDHTVTHVLLEEEVFLANIVTDFNKTL